MKSASQYGQDLFVLDVLAGKRNGFFLNSGASNGVHFSNTLLLEKYFGWTGICVEPNGAFFEELVENRRCKCLNCCLYSDGEVEFLEQASVLGGVIDDYDPSHLAYAKRSFDLKSSSTGKPETVRKRARTIRSVLRECQAPPVLDY